jgi:hypothetical protein
MDIPSRMEEDNLEAEPAPSFISANEAGGCHDVNLGNRRPCRGIVLKAIVIAACLVGNSTVVSALELARTL